MDEFENEAFGFSAEPPDEYEGRDEVRETECYDEGDDDCYVDREIVTAVELIEQCVEGAFASCDAEGLCAAADLWQDLPEEGKEAYRNRYPFGIHRTFWMYATKFTSVSRYCDIWPDIRVPYDQALLMLLHWGSLLGHEMPNRRRCLFRPYEYAGACLAYYYRNDNDIPF